MVALRELREHDAEKMIEWMHDEEIQKAFRKQMVDLSLNDAKRFCANASVPAVPEQGSSVHFAITDESDEYLGTISLKNIDLINENAEYAVVVRKRAQGRGIAYEASKLLLKKAFVDYRLNRVYLSVLEDNYKAVRLYEKIGFIFEGESRKHIKKGNIYKNVKWFAIMKSEFSLL